ncbi:response regulator [Stenotrophomonas maltophilia]|nr:response regulator [Stenotrophomonas maltophilia]
MLEAGNKPEGLTGLRVLVAEDEFAIAMFLVDYLELKGAQVVGPAGDLQALGQLVDTHPIDVALLDINLGGEQVYPLADRLAEAGTPFLLTSGYDDNLPSRFASAPRCTKPYHIETLVQQLAGLVAPPQVSAGIA